MSIMSKGKWSKLQVTKTEKRMKRRRNMVRYGLTHAKPIVRISKEDDDAKTAFLDGLKTTKTGTPSRSYLMSRGMWAELEKLDASL